MNLAQYLDQISACATTWIEHIDARVGETVRNLKFFAQHGIDTRNHVLDDLNRRIPDAQFFAQLRIEGLQEWFVEVLHRMAFFKVFEERFAIHAIENISRPIEHFHDIEFAKLCGSRDLIE